MMISLLLKGVILCVLIFGGMYLASVNDAYDGLWYPTLLIVFALSVLRMLWNDVFKGGGRG